MISLSGEVMKSREIPVHVGQEVILVIDRLGYRAEGVARFEGFTVFVPGALPGERVAAKINQVEKSYAVAALVAITEPSSSRQVARCPVYDQCGGCQLQHMPYEEQLEWKRQVVLDAFTRIGHFSYEEISPKVFATRGMDNPWRYRNKVNVAVAKQGGKFVAGFVEEGTHEPVAAAQCLIRPVIHDKLLAKTVGILADLDCEPYDEQKRTGDVRQIVIRTTSRDEAMVVIVLAHEAQQQMNTFCRRLDGFAKQEGIKLASVVEHIAPPGTRQLYARSAQVLWGKAYLKETLMGLTFRLSSRSFLQVNPLQTEVLYKLALDSSDLCANDVVFDLYSGIGTLSLLAAQSAKKVIGVESVPQAVDDAKANARKSGIDNAEFIAGKAEDVVAGLIEAGTLPDVVFFDPPRAGCDRKVLEAVAKGRPRRIVYVSCNPATLARDLRILADHGYALASAVPVDMFAQTAHVECVVTLNLVVVAQ